MVPNCSPGQDAPFDMQHAYYPRPLLGHDLTSTLGQVLNWPMKIITYLFQIVSTRDTQWCQSHVFIFLSSKVIKVTISKTFHFGWPLITSIITWAENVICKSCRSLTDLSKAICCLWLRCVVFEIWRDAENASLTNNPTFQSPPGIGLSRLRDLGAAFARAHVTLDP